MDSKDFILLFDYLFSDILNPDETISQRVEPIKYRVLLIQIEHSRVTPSLQRVSEFLRKQLTDIENKVIETPDYLSLRRRLVELLNGAPTGTGMI